MKKTKANKDSGQEKGKSVSDRPATDGAGEKRLPEGWVEVHLNQIGKIVSGGTPRTSVEEYYNGDIAWITPADLSGYKEKYISQGARNISELGLKKSSAKLMPKGAVLFSSRAPIGYVVIANNSVATNQGFKSIVPFYGVSSEYVYYFLKTAKGIAESMASGTTFKEISLTNFGKIPLPLPPLPEQHRIVSRLNALLARAAAARERLERVPELLRQFRQSVLARAVSGELTREWREEYPGLKNEFSAKKTEHIEKTRSLKKLPKNWVWSRFDQIAKVKSNLVAPEDHPHIPLIAPNNIEKDSGNLLEYQSVAETGSISPKHFFYPGQIIYSKIRPYLNKVVLVNFEGLCSADRLCCMNKFQTKTLSIF